jgi:2,5-diamino-6-(ribosylamino)-4(3H)-pyrimidinone 5'-phosphate reductase
MTITWNEYMKQKVILQNAISVDGKIVNFPVDMATYYAIMSLYKPGAHLTGSHTILSAVKNIPKETISDLKPPKKRNNDRRPFLVVPDSRGRIRCWHLLRKSGYWKDCIALVCRNTPKDYLEYLEKRSIKYIITGIKNVNYKKSFKFLKSRFKIKTIITDCGEKLNSLLLKSKLIDELSILIHPYLVGGISKKTVSSYPFSSPVSRDNLKLLGFKVIDKELAWIKYSVR